LDDGVLNIAAGHEDRNRYHRRFRFPKRMGEEDITAKYNNGILKIRLPSRPARRLAAER